MAYRLFRNGLPRGSFLSNGILTPVDNTLHSLRERVRCSALYQTRKVHSHALDKKHILVSPDSTTGAHAPTEVDLTGADLLWVWSTSVSEIPARLDIDRLCAALSKTLSVYRPACGRMLRNSTMDWKVLLTDSAIPVEVVECTNPTQFDDYVCQPSEALYPLLPYMTSAPHEVINNDLPLVYLKVTLSVEKTMLGISWHHAIGDGTTRLQFMSLLSRYYQGLAPLYPLPSFARHHFLTAATEDAKPQDDFAFIRELSDIGEMPMTQMTASPNVAVSWVVPRTKANILRQNMQRSLGSKVSVQDCLTAYIASAAYQCGCDIRRVNVPVGYRRLFPEWGKLEVTGNLIAIVTTGALEDADARDPRRVALKIRRAINTVREPERLAEIVRETERFYYSCAEKRDWGSVFRFGFPPYTLFSNPMASLTFQDSVNFGHPGTKYYVAQRPEILWFTRIQAANPTHERSAADAFDVSFAVPKSVRSAILEKLQEKNYLSPFD